MATDYRAELLQHLLEENPYILESIHTYVTDIIGDNLIDNQYFYTGLDEEEIAGVVSSYGIEEFEDMDDMEIAEITGSILSAFTRRLVSKILWNSLYEGNPTEGLKLANDDHFQQTFLELLDE